MDDETLIRGLISAIAAGADEYDERGQPVPPPTAVTTPKTALETLYRRIPGRLPRLFEQLLLMYRWPQAELGSLLLLPNPPSPELEGFAQQPLRDKHLAETLLPARYVQFGRGPYGNYDPVCFDLRRGTRRDCPIVQIDHEEILCNYRIRPVAEIAPSFRALLTKLSSDGEKQLC